MSELRNTSKANCQMSGKVIKEDWDIFQEIRKSEEELTAAKLFSSMIKDLKEKNDREVLFKESSVFSPESVGEVKTKWEKAQKAMSECLNTSLELFKEQNNQLNSFQETITEQKEKIQDLEKENQELQHGLNQIQEVLKEKSISFENAQALINELKSRLNDRPDKEFCQNQIEEIGKLESEIQRLRLQLKEGEVEKQRAILQTREDVIDEYRRKRIICANGKEYL